MWFVISFISIIVAYLADEYGTPFVSKKNKIVFRCLLALVLSYMTGLGGGISTDHNAYIWHYDYEYPNNSLSSLLGSFKIDFQSEKEGFEPLFVALNIICIKLGLSHVVFFLLISIITNALFVSVIFRFKLPYLSVLLFLVSVDYFQEVNLVRQMLAVSIFIYSLKYLANGQLFRYAFFIIIATFIHMSSFFLIPLLLVPYLINKGHYPIYVFLLILWGVSIFFSIGFVTTNFGIQSAFTYYETILGQKYSVGFDIIYNLVVLLFFIFSSASRSKISVYAVVFVLGCVFRNMAVSVFVFYRFSFYFTFVYCCFVPEFFSSVPQFRSKKNCLTLPVVMIAVYYGYVLLTKFILHEPASQLGTEMYSIREIF